MENKTYTFDVNGRKISVTTQEVLTFYGQHYGLKQDDIEKYAAQYTAHLKYHRDCGRWIDKALVQRLIEEERLMKEGEVDGFKLQLTFAWYVELKREGKEYLPFKYIIEAWRLDNAQTFTRRYTNLQDALLHCLNRFNENEAVQNRYHSIRQYLDDRH